MSISLEPAEWLSCCASTRWVAQMLTGQPYADLDALLVAAEQVWSAFGSDDVLEAVAAHPRIGERAAAGSTESREQAGTVGAGVDVLAAMADGNREYEHRFGMTYLVRASGRSAEEMLALLRERLGHDREAELAEAARQQGEITALRLRALIDAGVE